ncbi:glycoside hydrolase family 25 protein [Pseudofulvibacter geojedonensis]|uniref:Glycoside hydrolase family 25 protein n=1 Tax=Pseudofulvibacter geojedonensis TaxID=1123758 RepID=A0ABW3HYG8_9FLAO
MKKNKRKYQSKKKAFSFKKHIVFPIVLIALLFAVWHYRYALYYLAYQRIEEAPDIKKSSVTTQLRIFDVLQHHKTKVYGIDVSHYQGKINWNKAFKIQDSFPISFVFVRATAGKDRVDRKFKRNWKQVKKKNIVRGAYHYYRPNENSLLQANNFINAVRLEKGDLPPVLDIEDIPRIQSIKNLKIGLKRWLNRVEKHYGVKPIIYSGESFYNDHLYKDFSEYTCWIANYNYYVENIDNDWDFWQFTDKGSVRGIKEYVDVNIFNGDKEKLLKLTKK